MDRRRECPVIIILLTIALVNIFQPKSNENSCPGNILLFQDRGLRGN